MPFDQPHLYEIEDMMAFARKYSRLFIYGCAESQECLVKFFDICGITHIAGYITTWEDDRELGYRRLPKYILDTADLEGAGIVIGLSDRHFGDIIPRLRKRGFNDYFIMSEFNKQKIANKLTPHPRERISIEVNLVDHCNLNCQMCDHFSPLVKEPKLLGVDTFKRDMERLAELSGNQIGQIVLLGGEPLLHKDVNRFVEITRSLFPKCVIVFITNGLLLLQSENYENGNFWQCCQNNDVGILVTKYPINMNIQAIVTMAKQYGVKLELFVDRPIAIDSTVFKFSWKMPLNLKGTVDKWQFISCLHFNHCVVLRNGRLFTCPIVSYAGYFNEAFDQHLKLGDENSIDIHKAESYEEIADFVSRRVPFCDYCDIKHRRTMPWARSNRTMGEYVDEE